MTLSRPALEMLMQMFGETSNVQGPFGWSTLITEVREATRRDLAASAQPVNGVVPMATHP